LSKIDNGPILSSGMEPPSMPARNVSLTPHLADFLDRNVESGRFSNASEVVREGLRLLEQRQAEESAKLEALRAAVRVGLEDSQAGRVAAIGPGDELSFVLGLGPAEMREA